MKSFFVFCLFSVWSFTLAIAQNDTYPWYYGDDCPTCNTNAGDCGTDIWSFYQNQCTSYAAWMMNRDHGTPTSNSVFRNHMFGSASWGCGNVYGPNERLSHACRWADVLEENGYFVSPYPVPGAIAQWEAYEPGTGWAGHVAYVEEVNADGTVNVSEYNGPGAPCEYQVRESIEAPRYIRFNRYVKMNDAVINPDPIQSGEPFTVTVQVNNNHYVAGTVHIRAAIYDSQNEYVATIDTRSNEYFSANQTKNLTFSSEGINLSEGDYKLWIETRVSSSYPWVLLHQPWQSSTQWIEVLENNNGCISSFPYEESFENGWGGWTLHPASDADWRIWSGSTPSNGTGPSSASHGLRYAYCEASAPNNPNKAFWLQSPCFNLGNLSSNQRKLIFDYHMYGGSVGHLRVYVRNSTNDNWQVVFQKNGNQGSSWKEATVNLAEYGGSQVEFLILGYTTNGWQGDISIDHIRVGSGSVGGGGNPVTYCTASGENSSWEWIQRVQMHSLDNNSGNNGGYADFTGQSVSLNAGGSYYMQLTPGFSSTLYDEYWNVWIDFDHNGSFDDQEIVFSDHGFSAVGGYVYVPNSATNGPTRMRVAMKWSAYPQACEEFSYGEVEDYTVVINGGNGLTGGNGSLSAVAPGSSQLPELAVTELQMDDQPVSSITVFPNPVEVGGLLNVKVDLAFNLSEAAELTLVNLQGQVVQRLRLDQVQYAGQSTINLPLGNLPSGTYWVVVQLEETVLRQQVVVF